MWVLEQCTPQGPRTRVGCFVSHCAANIGFCCSYCCAGNVYRVVCTAGRPGNCCRCPGTAHQTSATAGGCSTRLPRLACMHVLLTALSLACCCLCCRGDRAGAAGRHLQGRQHPWCAAAVAPWFGQCRGGCGCCWQRCTAAAGSATAHNCCCATSIHSLGALHPTSPCSCVHWRREDGQRG